MIDASQSERETRRLAEGRELILRDVMKAEKKGKVDSLPYQNYLIRQVIESVTADIKADIKASKGAGAYKKFARYLGTIDPRLAALRAIQGVLVALLQEGGADVPQPIWKRAAYIAGYAVYTEYLMQHFAKLSPALFNTLTREYNRSFTRDERHLIAAFKAKFASEGFTMPLWEFGDIENVGSYILTRLVAHKFLESWSRTESKRGRAYTVRYIMLDEGLRNVTLEIMDRVAMMPRVSGAMIEEPLPWDAETNSGGGFHTEGMQRISPYAVQGKGVGRVAQATVDMVNSSQRRQWEINAPVLDAVRRMSLIKDFGDVMSPDPGPKPEYVEGFTEEQKRAWKGEARAWYTLKKLRAIKYIDAQRTFREAQDLRQYPTIWFTYYADFRGRGYARSASISPQGSDLQKGLLRLKNGRPLESERSVFWFKVHGANKFGKDKLTLAERVKWVDENHDFIIQMGTDPWAQDAWTAAESPVQFLAWALEYAEWVKDPDWFSSFIPLGQDGTCNGLQNFSALMCDSVGGAAVNLTPSDAPRDIYTDVAERVIQLLKAKGDDMAKAWLAVGLDRSWTKRTTMTLPYGCTRYGCSVFINDQIEAQKPEAIPKAEYGAAANYLSYVMWDALDDIIVKAREVMLWLQDWAKHAAQSGKRVEWTAPSGLHVVSEYEGMTTTNIKSVAFKTRIRLFKPTGKLDVKKLMNAVAPNFVHSLDASHMARVMAAAEAEGMEPVMIHDDFGVHAADTERFHEIIREQFVEVYEGNTILADMAAATGYEVPPPEVGDFQLRDVLRSTYFFS